MALLKITAIECIRQSDLAGPDEPWIEVNRKKVWGPGRIKRGEKKPIDVQVEIPARAEILVYERDRMKDDFLGKNFVHPDEAGGGEETLNFLEQDQAHYRLYYEVT